MLTAYLNDTCYKFTCQEREKTQNHLPPSLKLTRGSGGIPVSAAAACPGLQPCCLSKMRGARAHLRCSVWWALVKSVSFVRIAAISLCSLLGGWRNTGALLALGMVGCFQELLSPVQTAWSHVILEQPSSLLLPAYSDEWDELLCICSFFNLSITNTCS